MTAAAPPTSSNTTPTSDGNYQYLRRTAGGSYVPITKEEYEKKHPPEADDPSLSWENQLAQQPGLVVQIRNGTGFSYWKRETGYVKRMTEKGEPFREPKQYLSRITKEEYDREVTKG